LWRLQEETMVSTIRHKASAQKANAIIFIAQPICEVPWLANLQSERENVFLIYKTARRP